MRIICEGVQAIQAGENPKLIEDRLIHILPSYQQKNFGVSADSGEDKGRRGKAPKEKKNKGK